MFRGCRFADVRVVDVVVIVVVVVVLAVNVVVVVVAVAVVVAAYLLFCNKANSSSVQQEGNV